MKRNRLTDRAIKTLLIVFSTGFSLSALAFDPALLIGGGQEGGGGFVMVKGDQPVLDFEEAALAGVEYIHDITDMSEYKTYVAPILDRIKNIQPEFEAELILPLTQKSWLFVGTEIKQTEDPQTKLSVFQAADQTDMEISIYKPWWDRPLSTTAPEKQVEHGGQLIVHELVKSWGITHKISVIDVRKLTVKLALDTSLNSYKLVAVLNKLVMEKLYKTTEEKAAEKLAQAKAQAERDKAAKARQDENEERRFWRGNSQDDEDHWTPKDHSGEPHG